MVDLRTRALGYAMAGVAALVVSCGRQPAVGDGAMPASTPSTAVGTAGQAAESARQGSDATPAGAAVERDPEAIKTLESMAAYLRTLEAFQVRSETSRDEVLDDGQNVTFGGVVDVLVERPNRVRAEVTSDKQQRLYLSDGTDFTIWARRVNYYASIPAPRTLRSLADTLADKYNLEIPLADLFYWGERKDTDDIVGAIDIGASQVDGVTCEHYAFRQEGVDWQVWIQQGAHPLPRKLIITTTTDPARPQFRSVMTWNLAPSYNDAAFTFVPPRDAKRITLAPRGGEASSTGTSGSK
jgi:hypothetical protein